MVSEKRIDTLRMIVGSHPILLSHSKTSDVVRELQRVVETRRIAGGDRWLLQLLHTTRALDTCLSLVISQRGWNVRQPSLGAYLTKLQNKGVIVPHQRNHWQDKLVRPRNTYMHSANQMPPQYLAESVLDEMDSCMSVVLAQV